MGCSESTIKNADRDDSVRLGLRVDAPPPAAGDFKVVMAGDLGVGKSCFVTRFMSGQWNPSLPPTIGAAFSSREVDVTGMAGDAKIKLMVWDTAGEELYRAMTKSFFKGAHAGVILYDVTSPASLASVPGWVADLRDHVPEGVIVVAGNKVDVPASKQLVSEAAGQEVVDGLVETVEADGGSILHVRASAQTGDGVDAAFIHIASQLAVRTMGLVLPPGAGAGRAQG